MNGRKWREVPAKNNVFFTAGSWEKDIIFGGYLFSFSAVHILLELYLMLNSKTVFLVNS